MALDPLLAEDVRHWFQLALEDLSAARGLCQLAQPLPSAAMFHCQQSVEKTYKGMLLLNSEPFKKTHSLWELSISLLGHYPHLSPHFDSLEFLQDYAVEFRYPTKQKKPDLLTAQRAIGLIEAAFSVFTSEVPAEVRVAT